MMARARLGRFAVPFALLTVSITAAPRAQAADVAITDEARARFTAGVSLLKDPEGPRYEEAYREFKAAYAASPSYKILGNLGLCAMKLERDDEAIVAFETYLAEAPDLAPAEIAQVKADLHTLKVGVAHVTLESNPPGAMILDARMPVRGERVTNSYGPLNGPTKIGIRQGQHTLTAKLAGYPDVVWEVDASSADLGTHTFELKKAAVADQGVAPIAPVTTKTRPVPTTVYIGAAATGAFAVGAVVAGIIATGKKSEFSTKNDGRDPAAAQSLKDSGQTTSLIADVCIGGALVSAGLTAYFFFGRPTVEVPATASAAPRSEKRAPLMTLGWSPEWRPGGGGIAVSGQF